MKPVVLITGATGMTGFRTLTEILDNGFRARIVVRSPQSIDKLRSHPLIQPRLEDTEFVVILDPQAENAFHEAVVDVDYIIHLASTIPGSWGDLEEINVQRDFLDPAIRGSTRILESAMEAPSVKRVVMTSSIVALAPRDGRMRPDEIAAPLNNNDAVPNEQWAAYTASRILAHYASDAFMTRRRPHFDLVRTMPAYVQGRNDLVTRKEDVGQGSNDIIVNLVLGKRSTRPFMGGVVHLDDVAKAHVLALDSTLANGGDNFILAANGGDNIEWNDTTEIAREMFPDAVEEGILPLGGYQLSLKTAFDVSNSEEKLGIRFKDFEDMVVSVVGQYVELAAQERAASSS